MRSKKLIHVRNFVHINILIGVHCSKSLGFSFKICEWHFGVVTLQGSQMKTALQDYRLANIKTTQKISAAVALNFKNLLIDIPWAKKDVF